METGKPTGHGGPWVNANVMANERSNPYLFTGYDQRDLTITHQSKESVKVTIEIDPLGENDWVVFKEIEIKPGEKFMYHFPPHIQGRWIRFVTNQSTTITTYLKYN